MAGMAAAVLLISVLFQQLGDNTGTQRYWQHLSQPSEKELGQCSVCGGEGGRLCTHLPIISIDTKGQDIPGRPYEKEDGKTGYQLAADGSEEIVVSFYTVEKEGTYHHPDDGHDIDGTARMRYRGNSSRWFSKGSFRINTVESGDTDRGCKMRLLGMRAGRQWSLHGPFLDKTLMRNYICMNLSAQVTGQWTPEVRFCELIINGEYRGVYLLTEMIDVDENRLDLKEYTAGDAILSYLVRIEPHTNPEKDLNNFSFYSYREEPGSRLELMYPGTLNQTQQVKDYVQSDFSEIERLLYSVEMLDGSGAWKRELDMESFVNYYILMEFFGINDAFSASTYFYRDARGKLTAGPVWDFNNAFDNFIRTVSSREFMLSGRGWFAKLMQDEDFVRRVISRYRQLRRGVLSQENIMSCIEQTESWLGSAIDRNYEVWGYSFDPTQLSSYERRHPDEEDGETLESVNPPSYEQAVLQMREYITDRGSWLDEHISSLLQYCHPSRFANRTLG